jgi:hypothetical protein
MAKKAKLSHLEWLVKCRSRNQQTSLALFKLMKKHAAYLKKRHTHSLAAIGLVAVSFSLWRAVFLADRTDSEEEHFNHALSFLETLIGDNAIGYSHDKHAREWTFNYYTNNALHRLKTISTFPEKILPEFDFTSRVMEPRDFWEYLQKSLDIAVRNFGKFLNSKAS